MLTDAKDGASVYNIRVQKAGGINGRYKLVLKYTARKGQQKDAVSNDPRYQKLGRLRRRSPTPTAPPSGNGWRRRCPGAVVPR